MSAFYKSQFFPLLYDGDQLIVDALYRCTHLIVLFLHKNENLPVLRGALGFLYLLVPVCQACPTFLVLRATFTRGNLLRATNVFCDVTNPLILISFMR